MQRDIQQQPSASFPADWIKALVMRQLADNFAQLAAGDFDFDKWFDRVEENQIREIGRNSSYPLHPAHYWTGVDGQQSVDFVGRVENFEPDFEAFCRKTGVQPRDRATVNVSNAPSGASSPHAPRRINNMGAKSISKINDIFKADFELFGYRTY